MARGGGSVKPIGKLPPGVERHGTGLRIYFSYQGKQIRKVVADQVTRSTVAYAENKVRSIKLEIKEKRFDYASHFPDCPNLSKFKPELAQSDRTVAEGVKAWLEVSKARKAQSTYSGYVHKANHVTKEFSRRKIRTITKSEIELFQGKLIRQGLSVKSVNDIFTVMRGVWGAAFDDEVIKSNPLDRIGNLSTDIELDPDPFELSELDVIAKMDLTYPARQDINMILFACWTGLSISELMALAWEDIDRSGNVWRMKITRAHVETVYKVPKERSRVRELEILGQALPWIKEQYPQTFMLKPIAVEVTQRDNISKRTEEIRHVFINHKTGQPWNKSAIGRRFTEILRKAGVRHRGPNQCRHTFASQLLSKFVPKEWVAHALGHSDTTMIKKHYGKWIPNDTPSMSGMITGMVEGKQDSIVTPWGKNGVNR